MNLIDSHCHLDLIEEKGIKIDEILKNAEKNNVKLLQTICTKIGDFKKIYKYAEKYSNIYASVGTHPNNVDQELDIISKEKIVELCKEFKKIIGIGETGLDFYYQNSDKENQIYSFIEHIKAARETDLPVIIHSRNAEKETIRILEEENKKEKFKSLLHCFSSKKELAEKALDLGIYISISGIVSFKNANELQEIVKFLPLDKMLIETDSPYLAPSPYRGKVNQPAFVKNVAEYIAELKKINLEELVLVLENNFFKLFNLKT